MRTIAKTLAFTIVGAWFLSASTAAAWILKSEEGPPMRLATNLSGEAETDLHFPGAHLLYVERDRRMLRPKKGEFDAARITMAVRVDDSDPTPVQGNLFVKDKDGRWFQSHTEFRLTPGEWRTLEVDLCGFSGAFRPLGHGAAWNSLYATAIHSIGLSLYGQRERNVRLVCRTPEFVGLRPRRPLAILDWRMPADGETYARIESTFDLSREYFNPFDPDEIAIDVEAISENGETLRWPAFFTQDFELDMRFARELAEPVGRAAWAFRFTPPAPGTYRVRIEARDASGEVPETFFSEWRTLVVRPSTRPGYVRRSSADHRYFEFDNGDWFFPIGFNIHTVKDLRSEERLSLGYIPDRGTRAYEEYFSAMKQNGVNACEIWMASWTLALEWTSAHRNYHGLGRYNLENAWKMDRILDSAAASGVYVHLVLDNHGKLSSFCDQEWLDSPFNRNTAFADADGACLREIGDFFSCGEAQSLNRRRNRYIAARWGHHTEIFGIEFWSEINLTDNASARYKDGSMVRWHQEEAAYFRTLDAGRHLLTTHCSGDYGVQLQYADLYKLPEIDYLAGDAYRGQTVPFVDHLLKHQKALRHFEKPVLITEYGGSAYAGDDSNIVADLHAGLWGSLFCEQAGTPFLWWHEFIHTRDLYPHFLGFSRYLAGIDPRANDVQYLELPVYDGRSAIVPASAVAERVPLVLVGDRMLAESSGHRTIPWIPLRPPVKRPKSSIPRNPVRFHSLFGVNEGLGCLAIGNPAEFYGWIFERERMSKWRDALTDPPISGHFLMIDQPSLEGEYHLSFHDTMSGEIIGSRAVRAEAGVPFRLEIPAFSTDIAFKLRRSDSVAETVNADLEELETED